MSVQFRPRLSAPRRSQRVFQLSAALRKIELPEVERSGLDVRAVAAFFEGRLILPASPYFKDLNKQKRV